ncbi:hypothetical protein PMAYCL1PPCAC_33276 [Pristionchus mayeri]|uniref:Uncharacterized protein n=1 Tax=Pristionchus mayeri TaxID=1317129 RepID=A0AAN5DGF6_9BILA|nr:hypothetical protein PMAYCL1PPCAC_33276 [Pristionchus mayeri]
MLFPLLLLLTPADVESECKGTDCKYQCNQGIGSVSPHSFVSSARSVFSSPCSCNEGWNEIFCSQPDIYSRAVPASAHTPSVCICRKQLDSNLRCEQFLTRCYRRAEGGCKCCFRQVEEFCDHVECRDDHPQFHDANTTCACFPRPSDYPMEICEEFGEENLPPSGYRLYVLGFSVSAFVLLAAVVVILCVVSFLTMGCLVVTSKRRRHAREERERTQVERNGPEAEAFLR